MSKPQPVVAGRDGGAVVVAVLALLFEGGFALLQRSLGPKEEYSTTVSAGTPPTWARRCCRAASPAAGRNSRVDTVTAASTRAAPAIASATPGKWISRNGVLSSIPPVGRS